MLLTCCSTRAPLPQNTSKITHLPTDRRPFLKTGNSKSSKLLWLVDSGATHSLYLSDGEQAHGIRLTSSPHASRQSHSMFASQKTSSRSFKFTGGNLPAFTGHTNSRKAASKNSVFDGIIGLQTLSKHRAVLHFRKKQLSWKSETQHTSHLRLPNHPVSGHLILTARVNGTQLKFIVDTGAARSVMALHTAQRLNLKFRASSSFLTGAYGNRRAAYRTPNITLTIPSSSGVYLNQFLVVDLSNISKVKGLEDIDGLIGYDFLERNFSSIDFGSNKLYF